MGKSPAKWIKTVLLGKKSTKSGSIKTNEPVRTFIMCKRFFRGSFS
jgi:hypothetical protein